MEIGSPSGRRLDVEGAVSLSSSQLLDRVPVLRSHRIASNALMIRASAGCVVCRPLVALKVNGCRDRALRAGWFYRNLSAVSNVKRRFARRAARPLLPQGERQWVAGRVMRVKMVILLAAGTAFWIFGLIDQVVAGQSVMRYLALSAALIAIGVWRWQPSRQPQRRRHRDRRTPQEHDRTPPRE
jgi:hypothetical protein